MANKRMVKPWVKYAQKGVIVAVILGILYYTASISGVLPGGDGSSKGSLFGGGSKADDTTITIGVNTFCGFMPMMLLNNGLEPTEDCILYKNFGIKAKIIIQDAFPAGRQAFLNDEINLIYCTVDALPTEMSESSEMAKAGVKYIKEHFGGMVPSLKELKAERDQCLQMKAAQTTTYQYFKDYQRELSIACSNVDAILGRERSHDLSKGKSLSIS